MDDFEKRFGQMNEHADQAIDRSTLSLDTKMVRSIEEIENEVTRRARMRLIRSQRLAAGVLLPGQERREFR